VAQVFVDCERRIAEQCHWGRPPGAQNVPDAVSGKDGTFRQGDLNSLDRDGSVEHAENGQVFLSLCELLSATVTGNRRQDRLCCGNFRRYTDVYGKVIELLNQPRAKKGCKKSGADGDFYGPTVRHS
jgi:hypothetical protein